MRDASGSGSRIGGQMQLTILSAEILKSKIGAKLDISNVQALVNHVAKDLNFGTHDILQSSSYHTLQ